jgi:hypothetical protein
LERIVGVVGRPEFPGAVYPLQFTLCMLTAALPQPVPAWTRPERQRVCFATEPESMDDYRDYTGERASRIPSINSTRGTVILPGTGEAMWKGFAPTVVSTG